MNRSLLALLVTPALAAAALVGPLGTASYAGTCATVAEPPHLVYGEYGIHASATYGCAEPVSGIAVTVCVEERNGVTGEWWSRGCATTAQEEAARTATGTVTVDVMVYSTWLRTTATVVDGAGGTGAAKTPPVFWFNCACYVG
jgi:hypothetical protein